jgi:hypothetical protein
MALSSTWVVRRTTSSGMGWEARLVFPICLHEDGLQRMTSCIDFIPGKKPITTLERGNAGKWYRDGALRATNHPLSLGRWDSTSLNRRRWTQAGRMIYEFLNIFSSILQKQIVEFNIGRNSLESPFQTAVGFLPPFQEAVGSYRCCKWR